MERSMDEQNETSKEEEAEEQEETNDEKMFEPLCERLLSALSLLQTSLSEVLDVKDKIMSHMLPSSLQAQLAITAGRLFRSVSGLSVPSMELVRLVQLYSTPWEKKKEILAKLHSNYERKKSQLSVAIRRLQLLDGQFQHVAQLQRIGNWEKLFVRLMSTQSVGRRWKYRVESLRRKTVSGDSLGPWMESSEPLYDAAGGTEEDEEEKMSVEEFPAQADGASLFIETTETGVQTDKQTQDQETWTGESVTQRYLCASVSGLQGVSGKGLLCLLTFKEKRQQIKLITTYNPQHSLQPEKPTQEKGPTRSVNILNKSLTGVLRKRSHTPNRAALSEAEAAAGLSGAEEVKFEIEAWAGLSGTDTLEVLLYRETEGVTAVGELSIPQDLGAVQIFKVSLHPAQSVPQKKRPMPSPQISLFLSVHTQEETLPRCMDCATQAWSVEDLVMDATGIDLRYTSREDLEKLLEPEPEHLEASTSPLSLTTLEAQYQDSSTSPVLQYSLEQEDSLRGIARKVTSLQEMPVGQLEMLLDALSHSNKDLTLTDPADAEGQRFATGNDSQMEEPSLKQQPGVPNLQPRRFPGHRVRSLEAGQQIQRKDVSRMLLLQRALPTDVWERMRQLEETMKQNKQNMVEKLRAESTGNLERQLMSQRRLQAASELSSRQKDEICLPAVFMPTKMGQLFTPKAHLYFHPTGSAGILRLTQPPSILSLPPPGASTKVSMLNLFDPAGSLPPCPALKNRRNACEETVLENGELLPATSQV